jgi:drug/metabolite transporter (DMT)-like permease
MMGMATASCFLLVYWHNARHKIREMYPLANLSTRQTYLLAIFAMMASMLAFSCMNIVIRYAAESMHTSTIVFWRNLFSSCLLLPFMFRHGAGAFRTTRGWSHFWRAAVGIIGMQSWFYCVATLPLNLATALSFSAPLFMSLFAVLFLRESSDMYRWGALVAGIIGVIIILQPDTEDFNLQSLIVLFATSMWAVAGMLVKSLTKTEPSIRILFYMAFFMTLLSFPMALPHWQWLNAYEFVLIMCIALASTAAHWCLVTAYSMADIVKLMPFDFSRLIFTAILAYVFFDETSTGAMWLGAGIIIAAAVAIAHRDARHA